MRVFSITFTFLICCAAAIVHAWTLPLNVDVYEIKFNHGGSGSGITLMVDSLTTVAIPEYRAGSRNQKFAYTISTSPTVKVKFTAFPPDDPSLTIGAASTDSTWSLSPVAVTFNGSGISIGDNGFVDFSTETGRTIPSYIDDPHVEWIWKVNFIGSSPQFPPHRL